MARSIAIIGTLDTKGDQVDYLRRKIQGQGHDAIVIDVGVLGDVKYEATITRHQVAMASGTTLDEVISLKFEAEAMDKMTKGTCQVIKELHGNDKLEGVLAVGGSMGTALALNVLNVLPMGLPKIVISTITYSPAISPDLLNSDVIMLPWTGGLWGINEISRRMLDQAAGMIISAAEVYNEKPLEKNYLGISSLGMAAARYLHYLKPALEKKGYEVAVYHATGMGSRLLEKAIADGLVSAVLELQVGQELIDELCGSLFGPGPHRFEAAAEKEIPQIVSFGIIELCLWAPYKKLPPKLANRNALRHNPLLWMIPTILEERLEVARLLAKKLNKAKGPVAVVFPLRDCQGITKWGLQDPEGYQAFRKEFRRKIKPSIKVVDVDCSTDDKQFADEVLKLLDEMMSR